MPRARMPRRRLITPTTLLWIAVGIMWILVIWFLVWGFM